MKMRNAFLLVVTLASQLGTARAQTDTFTQVGNDTCNLWVRNVGHQVCQKIKFPIPFADVPKVTVAFSQLSMEGVRTLTVAATNVDEQGFTPVISQAIPPSQPPVNPGELISPRITPVSYSNVERGELVGQEMDNNLSGNRYTVSWVAVGSPIHHVTVHPKYLVLSVIYAPPGGNGGKGPSSVAYQSGTNTGTTTSASHTFKQGTAVSVSAKGGTAEASLDIAFSKSTTDDQTLDIKHSFVRGVNVYGPGDRNGLDPDIDQIILWLDPGVDLAVGPTSVAWTLVGNPINRILPVAVGWLNGDIAIPSTQAAILQQSGITEAEYCEILKRDPLADWGPKCPRTGQPSTPTSPRYVPVSDTIAYQIPARTGGPVSNNSINLSSTSTSTIGSTAEDSFTVGLSLSVGGDALITGGKLKVSQSWEWSNKSSVSNSTGTSTSATATVGGPSSDYTGKTFLQVYFDTIYRTFAFAFVADQPVALRGTVVTATGQPAKASTEVTLIAKGSPIESSNLVVEGAVHRAFTNARGEYTFYGNLSFPAILRVGNISREIPIPQPTADTKIMLK